MRPTLHSLSLAALAAAGSLAFPATLSAQESDPLALVPRDALVVGWSHGPAAIEAAFGGTRLAELFGGPEISSMLQPILDQARDEIGAELEKNGVDPVELERALLGYRGKIAFAFGMDLPTMIEQEFEAEPADAGLWAVLALGADGTTDLDGFVARVRELVERENPDGLVDVIVEGRSFPATEDGDVGITLPFVHDGNAVIVLGGDLEWALSKCLFADGDRFADRGVPHLGATKGVWADVAPWIGGIEGALAGLDQSGLAGAMFDAIGIRSLRDLTFTVDPAGEHVAMDLRLRTDGPPTGLLGAAMRVPNAPPTLLDVLPVQRETWSASRVDFAAGYAGLRELAAAAEPMTTQSVDDLEAAFEGKFRVRLKEDLIDQLGDEMIQVVAGAAARDEEADAQLFGQCFGLALRDGARFGESFEKMLRSQGLHAARKSDDYRGTTVHRLGLAAMFELHYAITDRLALFALDEAGSGELRAVLDEIADRAAGRPRADLPEAVAERLEQAPADWHSISVNSVAQMFRMLAMVAGDSDDPGPFIYDMFGDDADAESGPERGETGQFEQIAAMAEQLARRYGLDTMVQVSRSGADEAHVRVIW